MKNIWKNHRSFLIILILILPLRLPLLFEPFTYADEGIYLTLGQAIRRGLILYRDIHDNKPPMLYLMAALGGNFFTYRLIYFLWNLVTVFAFYRLASFLFGEQDSTKNKFLFKKHKAIFVSTSLFAITTSLPMFEGNIANAENFMLLPILTGFYLIFKFLDKNKLKPRFSWLWFLAGALFSIATLFKVPAVFDFIAALLICLLIIKIKVFKAMVFHFFSSIIGFLTPLFLTFAFFAMNNALSQYIKAAFSQNIPYLSSWGGQQQEVGDFSSGFLFRGLFLVFVVIAVFFFRKKLSLTLKLIIIWFFFSLFATLLSSRPYPHYLLQILPALCLSFGLFFSNKNKFNKILPLALLIILVLVFRGFRFWYYPNWAYFENFYQYTLKIKSKDDYFKYFNPQAKDFYQTADFIRNRTSSEEKIFIWGTRPSIYALSKRLPVGRYTVSYHIFDFKGQEETLDALHSQLPRWIIVSQDEKRSFPKLEDFIKNHYSFFKEFGKIQIFYLLPKAS